MTTTSSNVATEGPWTSLKPPLHRSTLKTLSELGFTSMTLVQSRTIPQLLSSQDVVVESSTGSGKTLAFLIPAVELALRRSTPLLPREVCALVVCPTRELALQVSVVASQLCPAAGLSLLGFIGGTTTTDQDLKAVRDLSAPVVVVATPGRLLEVLNAPGVVGKGLVLKSLELLVLDEGDRLLEMGFRATLTDIVEKLPKQRRTGLFSATQTEKVSDLTRVGTRNPVTIAIRAESDAENPQVPSTLDSQYVLCPYEGKITLLVEFLEQRKSQKIIVYFLTCSSVDYHYRLLASLLPGADSRVVVSLHGKAPAKARAAAYSKFVESEDGVLLCTDVAARGLDIPKVNWIVQFDPPQDPSVFVHRIGRTARMGSAGCALILLTPSEDTYVDFLKLRGVPVRPCEDVKVPDEASQKELLERTRELAKGDRDVFIKAQDAFVSWVRAYKEHHCASIFKFAKLDLAAVARGMGLVVLPRMTELKGRGITGFESGGVKPDDIPFKDAKKEAQRQQRLRKMREEAEENEARWRREEAEKNKERERKRVKRGAESEALTLDEIDEINQDAKLLSKRKRGKLSEKNFEKVFFRGAGAVRGSRPQNKKRRR